MLSEDTIVVKYEKKKHYSSHDTLESRSIDGLNTGIEARK